MQEPAGSTVVSERRISRLLEVQLRRRRRSPTYIITSVTEKTMLARVLQVETFSAEAVIYLLPSDIEILENFNFCSLQKDS